MPGVAQLQEFHPRVGFLNAGVGDMLQPQQQEQIIEA